MSFEDEIRANVESILSRIARAAERCGREASTVRLVAVSKTQPVDRIRAAVACGLSVFGENRVQEATAKIEALSAEFSGLSWILIGRLQTNKARSAVKYFQEIQSVDRPELVSILGREARALGKTVDVLLEVNLGGEESKAGVEESRLPGLYELAAAEAGLSVRGLMAVPPFAENPEEVRPFFRRLAALREDLRSRFGAELPELSMGMSHDFEVAIEEGATQVRIGTAIFGERVSG
jgi:hypothetical protein